MNTYHVVLYVHIVSLLVGMSAGAVLVACLFRLRAAQTLADAVPFGMLAGKVEKLFPVAILGLFGSGAYMTTDLWTWRTSWIDASIVGLVALSLQGPLVGGRTARKLEAALHANGPGELREEARRLTRHPGLWVTEFTNLCLVLAIVWNMTEKPGTAGAYASIVVAYAVGAALALRLTRAPGPEAVAVSEPA